MTTTPGHTHYYVIDPANGATSWGECQNPGCPEPRKEFRNLLEADTGNWQEQMEAQRKAQAAQARRSAATMGLERYLEGVRIREQAW